MESWWDTHVTNVLEALLLMGASLTAIGYGFKRVYNMARGVEKILEFNTSERTAREVLAVELKDHIKMEETRNEVRDHQILELVNTIREIGREIRPNGGSSMKDVLNHTAERVGDISTRVAVIEEWKRIRD